jgi:hypothetical protein
MVAINSAELKTRPDAHLLSNGLQFGGNKDVIGLDNSKKNAYAYGIEKTADLYNLSRDIGAPASSRPNDMYAGTPSKGTVLGA